MTNHGGSALTGRPRLLAGPLRSFVTLALVGILYVATVGLAGGNPYYMLILSLSCINVMCAVSLNLINGCTGLFSIGHAGFLAVGAYVAACLTKYFAVPLIFALVFGGLFAALVGVLVGLPTLRLRGDYLAIATLGFGEIIRVIIVNISTLKVGGVVMDIGGPRGLMAVPQAASFAWAFLGAAVTIKFAVNFINSSHGRACLAIREDEVAAEAMGVNTTFYKVAVFAIGAFFAGCAGGLYAHLYCFVHPDSASFLRAVDYVVMIVIGGLGSTTGAALAAVSLTVLSEALRKVVALRMVTYSLLLVVVMLARPQGLLGARELTLDGMYGAALTAWRYLARAARWAGVGRASAGRGASSAREANGARGASAEGGDGGGDAGD
jgi:branched-chain amino acid transport system permease protein